jgi:hypothetical protein
MRGTYRHVIQVTGRMPRFMGSVLEKLVEPK